MVARTLILVSTFVQNLLCLISVPECNECTWPFPLSDSWAQGSCVIQNILVFSCHGSRIYSGCLHNINASFTGLPKVENVMFGNNTVVDNVIWQNITWSTVQLPNDDPTYYIQYNTSTNRDTTLPTAVSSTNSYTLKLKVPSFNTTLTVWIVATRTSSNHAKPSDPQTITYTST